MNTISDINWDLYFKAKEFLIDSFNKNPSYSFGDASIMIEHSLNVVKIGINLCGFYKFDVNVVIVGCMFHDIGKAMLIDGKPIDSATLRTRHEEFNLPMLQTFIEKNSLDGKLKNKLLKIFDEQSNGGMSKLIKDADIIELYMNVRLQKALKEWADKNGYPNEMQRKADKFETILAFDKSKEMARPYWEAMKIRWNLN